jgi:hypothetical protein
MIEETTEEIQEATGTIGEITEEIGMTGETTGETGSIKTIGSDRFNVCGGFMS